MYDRFFNCLAVLSFAGAVFITCALPFVFEPDEPAPTAYASNMDALTVLSGVADAVSVPDYTETITFKKNRDKALTVLTDAGALYDYAFSIKPVRVFVPLVYVGKFYITKYAATAEQCGNDLGITASGKKVTTDPTCWTVAVDPAVIPLGTKLKIDLAGYENVVFEACDTGSAINGFDVDIFTESESESKTFNPCYAKVYIVEEVF